MHLPKRPHYAWLICLGGALAMFITQGLGVNVFSVFMPYITAEEAFTNTQISLIPTVRNLFSLASLFFVNPLCRRFGPRALIAVGSMLTGICYLGFALCDSFFAYCCYAALIGLGCTFSGAVPVAFLFVKWFETRRSFAMGIAVASSGLAQLILPYILTPILTRSGLNPAFLCQGGICLVLTLVAILLIRNTPDAISATPYCRETANKKAPAARHAPLPRVTRLHTALFLLVAILMSGPIGTCYTHISMLLDTAKHPETIVSSAVSFMGFMLMVSKILWAEIYDRIGGWLGNFFVCGITICGLTLLVLFPTGSIPILFLALALYGLGLAIGSISTYQWSADLYGAEGYADGVRSFNLAYTLGTLIFGAVPGFIADLTGSYVPAFALFCAVCALAACLLQVLYHRLGLHKC